MKSTPPARENHTIAAFMYSLLAKRAFSFFPSSHLHRQYLSLFPSLLRLSLSTKTQQQKEELPFIAQYLVSTFGFSLDRALKVSTSRKLTVIKTPDRPDALVSFLKEIGLSDSQISSLVSFEPSLLKVSVDKTLKRQACALIDAGFTGEILVELVQSNPLCLCMKDTLSRLQFWRTFIGNNDGSLLKVLRRSRLLIQYDIDNHVIPRLNLLKEFGLSDRDIVNLLMLGQRVMTCSLDTLRQMLERTEELGFTRGSTMFVYGLRAISCCGKEMTERKVEFFQRMYGWSEEEFSSAIKKFPNVITLSEENIRSKMEFLIKNVGFEPRSVASQPKMLCFSLKRLMPRHKVLSALEAKALKKSYNLSHACSLSEKHFLDNFVLPYEKDLPGLSEAYFLACRDMVAV